MSVVNPWLADQWSITDQGAYVKAFGVVKAQAAAKKAGVELGATKPKVVEPTTIIQRNWVFQKRIGGGGISGNSGSGPPV